MNPHRSHNTSIIKTRYHEYKFYCTDCQVEFATTNKTAFIYYKTELRMPTSFNVIEQLLQRQQVKR